MGKTEKAKGYVHGKRSLRPEFLAFALQSLEQAYTGIWDTLGYFDLKAQYIYMPGSFSNVRILLFVFYSRKQQSQVWRI